jgi:hypothetical protein
MDSVGLLNLLVVVIPLMSPSPSSVVFTETLVPSETDATKWFASRFCGDIPTVSLTLDLLPTTYLSRMTTRSDRGGVLLSRALRGTVGQYYEPIVWKRPWAGDSAVISAQHDRPLLSFGTNQLAQLLLSVYHEMFALDNPKLASSVSSLPHYTRESFALFLRILRSVADVEWQSLMDRFYDVLDADMSLLMGSNYSRTFGANCTATNYIQCPLWKGRSDQRDYTPVGKLFPQLSPSSSSYPAVR